MVDDHDYIALSSPLAASRFALSIFAKVRSLAELGLTGVSRSEFGEGLRSIAYRERIIFFRIRGNELVVVRVLHGHQEISPDYFKTDEN
ncbi:type II toxin-antitoxin system RelE/ParE family toxin [Neorhizobium petrolearium]